MSIKQQKSSSTSAQKIAQSRSRGHRGGVSQVASTPDHRKASRVHLVRGVKEAVDLDGGEEGGSVEVDNIGFG